MSKKKIIHLLSGSFEQGGEVDEKTGHLDKKVMMVYCGKFESMDGPVEIKDEDIEKLVANHNEKLAKLSRMASGEVPLKNSPPIQLDHSTSARDTVGRLVGPLSVGQYQPEGGVALKAMYGTARFLGKDNIEKVQDGRWSHVSMGADLETHTLSELTVTPFPAAADAALLSAKLSKQIIKGHTIETEDVGNGKWKAMVDGQDLPGTYDSNASAMKEGRLFVEEHEDEELKKKLKRLAANAPKKSTYKECDIEIYQQEDSKEWCWTAVGKSGLCPTEAGAASDAKKAIDEFIEKNPDYAKGKKRLSEDTMGYKDMKEKMAAYAKCKQHLMDEKKMSEEDAEKHLESASDDDVKKMAADHDEKMKHMAEDEEKKKSEELKRMASYKEHKSKMIAFSKGMKDQSSKVQLANTKLSITARLTKLKAEGKVTPAEIKSMDIDKLSASSKEVVDATLKTFDTRQPVIDTGLIGTTKALSAGQLAGRLKKMAMEREELQTRLNMPSKREEALKRLKELDEKELEAAKYEPSNVHDHDVQPDKEKFEQLWSHMKGLLDSGKHDEAKEHLRKHLSGVGPDQIMSDTGMPVSDPTPQMSALADGMKKMQTEFDEIVKLTAPIFDIKPEELV